MVIIHDSLDTADQIDFTRRLAIEFAKVDGCGIRNRATHHTARESVCEG